MKNNLVLFVISVVLLFSCSHSITKLNYINTKPNNELVESKILIKRGIHIDDKMVKVGEIKLADSGFSWSCSELEAVQILKREAKILGADLIFIKSEKYPDFFSSCYRCEAEFYQTNSSN
ncbi:hypothetical protein EP331_07705 [bacterium]|nr:MAG: hypothetical protein EP331_07705 [bacterium]